MTPIHANSPRDDHGSNYQSPLLERGLTGKVIGIFYDVYNELQYGFLESVYRRALRNALRAVGLRVEEEAPIDVIFRGERVGFFRADLLIERRLILEIKASKNLVTEDKQQLLNYLRACDVEVGLLLHFGPKPKFERVIFTRRPPSRRSNSQ